MMKNKRTPFKDIKEFEKEFVLFINVHKAKIAEHSQRISDYFEMSCFNMIIRYYENNGYMVECENLIKGEYRYKCSTQGIQTNFSHFSVSQIILGERVKYDIHHNLAIQSFHHSETLVVR